MKALIEKRNDLAEKMANIVNVAKAENRAVTEAEATEFANLEKEIQNIDNTIAMQDKVNSFEKKVVEPAKEMSNKEKDEKAFKNIIRQIYNVDTPIQKSDMGVTIPTTIAQRIIEKVEDICPIWNMAEHFNLKGKFAIPQEDDENSNLIMTYADEYSDAESGKTTLKNIVLDEFLGRALAKVPKSLINNSQFDIVNYVINKVAKAVSKFLEQELLKGTKDKIEGLSGVTLEVKTADATKITSDELIDLQEEVIDAYQQNAVFIMNRKTRKLIRKLKDAEGRYLLERDFTARWKYTLLGKEVYTTDAMDDLGAGKTAIYYGDFTGLAVKISEEINIQVLSEKYAEQHAIGILAFVGCDAKVQDTQKIAKLVGNAVAK